MNKNYKLRLDLQFEYSNVNMTFSQFDNNTSDFSIMVTSDEELVKLDDAIVVLAVIKPSGKVSSQFVEVNDNIVYANLEPHMKNEIGEYTAKAMLISKDKRVVTDNILYKVTRDDVFGLLNDSVQYDEDFALLTDILSRLSVIESNEDTRIANERDRQTTFNNIINEINESRTNLTNTVNNKMVEVDNKMVEFKDEINRNLGQTREVFMNMEGNFVTTDSNKGHLKNLEIHGSTIQDASNLKNIQSVGDKIDGQEFYKISLLSYGENHLRPEFEVGTWNVISGVPQNDENAIRTNNFIKVHNVEHFAKRFDGNVGCHMMFYDENFKPVSFDSFNTFDYAYSKVKVLDERVKYMRLNFLNTTDLNLECILLNYMPSNIYEVPYVPYEEATTDILSTIPLREVGGWKDKLLYKNDILGVENTILDITLNGEESWEVVSTMKNCISFKTKVESCRGKVTPIATILKPNADGTIDEKGVFASPSSHYICVTLPKSELDSQDVEGCKAWFRKNPTTFIYPTIRPEFVLLPQDQQPVHSFKNQTTIVFLTRVEGTIKSRISKSLEEIVNTNTERILNLTKEVERINELEKSIARMVETQNN